MLITIMKDEQFLYLKVEDGSVFLGVRVDVYEPVVWLDSIGKYEDEILYIDGLIISEVYNALKYFIESHSMETLQYGIRLNDESGIEDAYIEYLYLKYCLNNKNNDVKHFDAVKEQPSNSSNLVNNSSNNNIKLILL